MSGRSRIDSSDEEASVGTGSKRRKSFGPGDASAPPMPLQLALPPVLLAPSVVPNAITRAGFYDLTQVGPLKAPSALWLGHPHACPDATRPTLRSPASPLCCACSLPMPGFDPGLLPPRPGAACEASPCAARAAMGGALCLPRLPPKPPCSGPLRAPPRTCMPMHLDQCDRAPAPTFY
jgi:hypothetical protein